MLTDKNQDFLLHDLIKEEQSVKSNTQTLNNDAFNIRVIDVERKVKSSAERNNLTENKENLPSNEPNVVEIVKPTNKVHRTRKEERPKSKLNEPPAPVLNVQRELTSKEVYDLNIENLTLMLHDLIGNSQQSVRKTVAQDDMKLFNKSKAGSRLAEHRDRLVN